MNHFTLAFVVIALGYIAVASGAVADDTLLLVHTLFRHGNRTPDFKGYDNNPISNESFYEPEGYSQLTNKGKVTEYKIGTTLRQRYNRFLETTWNINYLEARTTNVNRTKMSLELALAGLYPPVRKQRWLSGLNWQPIPYNYLSNDKELSGISVCSNYATMFNAVSNSAEIQEKLAVYQDVFDYVSNQTGESFTTPTAIFGLYFSLIMQKEYGYPLEDWAESVLPDLEKITKDVYYIGTNTTDLKKIAGGYLLKKIISDSEAKINGTIYPSTRKMFLYSAHEKNVANFLLTLGVYDDQIPVYGSHVIIELRLIRGIYGLKVYYQDWSSTKPKLLTIPGCTAFCPFDDFVALFEEVIPTDDFCE